MTDYTQDSTVVWKYRNDAHKAAQAGDEVAAALAAYKAAHHTRGAVKEFIAGPAKDRNNRANGDAIRDCLDLTVQAAESALQAAKEAHDG